MSQSHALPASRARRWKLVERAPYPDAPIQRDAAGAQHGMLIALGAGALFWAAVTALVVGAA